MRAGPLRHRCTLLQFTAEPDGMGGQKAAAWVEVGKVWAEITLPTGRTSNVANQVVGLVTAEIRIRYRSNVVEGLRIVFGTTTHLIEAALPDNEKSMLRLLCSIVPIL